MCEARKRNFGDKGISRLMGRRILSYVVLSYNEGVAAKYIFALCLAAEIIIALFVEKKIAPSWWYVVLIIEGMSP